MSVIGSDSPFCVKVPTMLLPSIFPSNEALIVGMATQIFPSAVVVLFAFMPLAPWVGESKVQPSGEKLNTNGSFVP